jgi:hypothetical protein
MTLGTRSLLFGVHQFLIHPWFVAAAWWQLYGFPWDPRLWVAFLVHDWGYWGSPNMDGPEGEAHPFLGAAIMGLLFGVSWYDFCLLHSRFFAKQLGVAPSKLCYADKWAIVITPWWLYLPLARASGELTEYMTRGQDPTGKYAKEGQDATTPRAWYAQVQNFVRGWTAREYQS